MTGLAARGAWHLRLAVRASRFGIAAGAVGGFLLHFVIPVRGWWLPAAVALGAALVAAVCVGFGGRQPLPTGLAVGPTLEKVGGADQVAHGLARASLVLAAFALGLWLGGLAALRP